MNSFKALRHYILIIFFSLAFAVHPYNIRKLTADDGLTNSAILSLCFQSNGILWIGTLDGLNASDGSIVLPTKFMPDFAGIQGNIIENIRESSQGVLWVQTNYGITRVIPSRGVVDIFPQFRGQEKLEIGSDGMVFLLAENGDLSYFSDKRSKDFEHLVKLYIPFSDVKFYKVSQKSLRMFTAKGIIDYPITIKQDKISLGKPSTVSKTAIKYAFDNGESVLAIDNQNNLLEYRPGDDIPLNYLNLSDVLDSRGAVSAMISDKNGNIFLSFYTDGLVRLTRHPDGKYSPTDLNLNVGVLSMAKSPQDVICIGTDCHGVYSYYEGRYDIHSMSFNDFDDLISHPVRAVYIDDNKTLWLGTKGDGILKVPDFDLNNVRNHGKPTLLNVSNSELHHNSVYSFAKSKHPIFWIGDEGGISYYSYRDNKIRKVDTGNIPIRWVSSLNEKDSILYISTNGDGVFKARIDASQNNYRLTDIKHYTLNNGNLSSNFFFTQTLDDLDEPLFGNRGLGVYKISGDSLVPAFKLKNDYSDVTIDDVFSIVRDDNNVWLGTGHGLLNVTKDSDRLYFGQQSGFLNSTIHTILKDNLNNLWLSTNHGILRFDPFTEKTYVYSQSYGLPINEFSDGAAFKSDKSLLFGGVDGLVILTDNENFRVGNRHAPDINVFDINIFGKSVPVNEYLSVNKDGGATLKLKSDETNFKVTFIAPDFLNSSQYRYYYSLDDNKWIDNGNDNTVTLSRLHYGDYKLKFKYVNGASDIESEPYLLNIKIAAPWYLSTLAKIIYALMALAVIFFIVRLYVLRQRRKQEEIVEKLEQAKKDEVYEQKLKFFTNVTHEFCTPLTLIFGSCERLLSSGDPDSNTQKYAALIRSNTERLNSLIQDLINFRKYENGVKRRRVISVNISELCDELFKQFKVVAEQNSVNFSSSIEPDLVFNTDYEAFVRIATNLLSNAFKYTPKGGDVRFSAAKEGDNLKLNVYNTGKGISEEEKMRIFDHYSIFDNVEENATKGLSARNGLGMAICDLFVKLLDGKIDIESELGKYAEFIVTLPNLELGSSVEEIADESVASSSPKIDTEGVKVTDPLGDEEDIIASENKKPTILVVDDNVDILTLLSDSLSEYNVLTAQNAEEGMEVLKGGNVDLIITDVMMPGTDGINFTKQIKGDKHTMHIPLIILSAKNTSDEKVQGIASGADAYVGKPFYMSYLRALIVRLLENKSILKEYYNTSASAFEYSGGQLIEKEDKAFIDKIINYINENLDDTEMSPETLASHMQVSVRNLYRKFKDLDLPSPNDFIKSHRITFAAKLLITTSLTVQEIIYRSGFNNRSHFYREFNKVYGVTPKDYRIQNKN